MLDIEQKVSDNTSDISKLKVDLSALKEKVSFFNVIYGKFDVTLGKIQEMIENRRYENNEDIKEVYLKLEQTESRIMAELKNVRDEMKALHQGQQDKISEIDKWRWVVIGGAIVAGWFLQKLFTAIIQ